MKGCWRVDEVGGHAINIPMCARYGTHMKFTSPYFRVHAAFIASPFPLTKWHEHHSFHQDKTRHTLASRQSHSDRQTVQTHSQADTQAGTQDRTAQPRTPSNSPIYLLSHRYYSHKAMSTNTESNFRNAFKSFGARGGVAAADATGSSSSDGTFGRASSWLGGVRNQVQGYVPVSLGGTPAQEEDWLGLSWFQRMAGFAICVAGGIACFMIAFFVGLPLFVIKPSKFATSFTLGSVLLMTR